MWEVTFGGSDSWTFIFGVKNGQWYEPKLSGKMMAFGTPAVYMGVLDYIPKNQYVGYVNDLSKGHHEYIPHFYNFNEKLLEFEEVK